jgi:hypothetical protein
MKSDDMLVRLAEIAASATALHRAMNGLPEASETTELVNRVLELAIGTRESADAGGAEDSIPMRARPPQSLLQMVERWHQLGDLIDQPAALAADELLLAARELLAERAAIEARIVAGRARGDADLLAKAGALRRLVEQDGNAEDRLGRLTLSLLDDIEQIVGGEPC